MSLAGIFTGKFEFQIFGSAIPAKVGGAEIWMFVPSLIVGDKFVLCQGE